MNWGPYEILNWALASSGGLGGLLDVAGRSPKFTTVPSTGHRPSVCLQWSPTATRGCRSPPAVPNLPLLQIPELSCNTSTHPIQRSHPEILWSEAPLPPLTVMGHHILPVLESHSLQLVPALTSATVITSCLALLPQHHFSNPVHPAAQSSIKRQ